VARDFIPLDGFGSRQGPSSRPDLVRRYGIYRCLPDGGGHRTPDHHGCRHVMGTPETPLRLGPAQRPAFDCAGTGSKRLGRDHVALCQVPTSHLQTPAQKTGATCSPEGTSGGSADVMTRAAIQWEIVRIPCGKDFRDLRLSVPRCQAQEEDHYRP
jgi:hypothetical protein